MDRPPRQRQGLTNSGYIELNGGTGASPNQTTLVVTEGPAPTTLTGSYSVYGDALVEFAFGEITSIGTFAAVLIDGADARIADSGTPDSNSALTGLTTNAGFSICSMVLLSASTTNSRTVPDSRI